MHLKFLRPRPLTGYRRRTSSRALVGSVMALLILAASVLLVAPTAHADTVSATIAVGTNPSAVAITPTGCTPTSPTRGHRRCQ